MCGRHKEETANDMTEQKQTAKNGRCGTKQTAVCTNTQTGIPCETETAAARDGVRGDETGAARCEDAVRAADARAVIAFLTDIMRGDAQALGLAKAPDLRERIKAAELLGKYLGLFSERMEFGSDLQLQVQIDYGEDAAA